MRCHHCAVEAAMACDVETKTMDAWNEEGRRISKGAKMAGRDDMGAPVFARRDTYERGWHSNNRNLGLDWDIDTGWSDLGIDSFQG